MELLKTATGVPFGIWGTKPARPAPTLFIFASTIERTLGEPYYRQCGNALSAQGCLCISLDLPCHGREKRPEEPAGLAGWRYRTERGEPWLGEFVARARQVLDYLVAEGYTDPCRVAACGTSRGGFAALHFAAGEPRVKCVAAFAPVTDLAALQEFRGAERSPQVAERALSQRAPALAGRALWLVIGDQDRRVDTDRAIAFARRITAASIEQQVPARVELHVLPEPRGHATPQGTTEQAAAWMARQLGLTRGEAPKGKND